MTATFATLPTDIILSIRAFLSDPLDLLSLSQTCRSGFLASQAWASYWSKLVPAVHLSRPAPWHSYSPSELRDAHVRYAATHRRWESPSPIFKDPLRLPPPPGSNGYLDHSHRWRSIRRTRWAWSLHHSTGEVRFCDLRSGLVIGEWGARGSVIDAFIESRSPNECVLCHWMMDSSSEFEIVATSVTFEQESLTSPIKLSFRTIQKLPVGRGVSLSYSFSCSPTVLWHDYLIGSFTRAWPRTRGLYIWSLGENSIFYFETEFAPCCTKIFDDVLFVSHDIPDGTHWTTVYRCIHIPSLVISTQLPGGSLSLAKNAFDVLLPKYTVELRAARSLFLVHTEIYSIPACPPTHPRYCFIIKRFLGQSRGVEWDALEVEIDLSISGPIKVFSKVSQQYTVQRPTGLLHNSDDDLFLYLHAEPGDLPRASLSVQFLRVGKPGKWRVARLGGIDKMRLTGLDVDRDAGYVIIWAAEDSLRWSRDCAFICWLDERKADNMVHSRTKKLISSWSRGLLRRF